MATFMIGVMFIVLAAALSLLAYMLRDQDEMEVNYYADLDDDGKPYV